MQSRGVDNEDIEPRNYSVGRIKKEIAKDGSYIGFLTTQSVSTQSDRFNSLYSLDGVFWIKKEINASFNFAATLDSDLPDHKNLMYGARINRFKSKGFVFDIRYCEYMENFAPELGFVSRPNSKRLTTNFGCRFLPVKSRVFSKISMGHFATKYKVSSTNKDEWFQTQVYFGFNTKKGYRIILFVPVYESDYLYEAWEFSENINIPVGFYQMLNSRYILESGNSKRYSFKSYGKYGQFYGGRIFRNEFEFAYTLGKHIKMNAGINFNQVDFAKSFSTTGIRQERRLLYICRLNLSINSKLSIKALLQFDNTSNSLGTNAIFRYNPKEGTDLYIVFNNNSYTDNYETPLYRRPKLQNQILILKFTKTFVL